jgi:hypothetical protein
VPLEDNNLIALDAGGFVDGLGVEACSAEISFCPRDKECRCPVDLVEKGKIQIAAIHDIDGPQLDDQPESFAQLTRLFECIIFLSRIIHQQIRVIQSQYIDIIIIIA